MFVLTTNFAARLVLVGFLLAPLSVHADSESFDVSWSGVDWGNTATASGVLTIDDSLFPASSSMTFLTPGVEVLGFTLTVSGASSGNGDFQLTDFTAFTWNTTSDGITPVPLDFTQQLVGQPTLVGPWGSTHDGVTGDFNLLAVDGGSAPTLSGYFTMSTSNGIGDKLDLTSFSPAPVPVPAALWLFGSAMMGICLNSTNKKPA